MLSRPFILKLLLSEEELSEKKILTVIVMIVISDMLCRTMMVLTTVITVTVSRQIQDMLDMADTHPNSVYSQINKHNNKPARIFYQTGVS